MSSSAPPRIAIINNDSSVLETVTMLLEDEGYIVVPALVDTLLAEGGRFTQFLEDYAPQVVLWDISPPYEVNWQRFQQIKHLPQMQNCPCILTTTDARRLEDLTCRAAGVAGILGKPFDLERMLNAIQKALAERGEGKPSC